MEVVGDTRVEPEELDPTVATGFDDSVVGSDDGDNAEVDGFVDDTPINVVEGAVGGAVLGTDVVLDPEVVPVGFVLSVVAETVLASVTVVLKGVVVSTTRLGSRGNPGRV